MLFKLWLLLNMTQKVLFVCIHNSARSQMAEAFLNYTCSRQFEAQSAGLEPGKLNPLAVQVMGEIGLDISKKQTQSVSDVTSKGNKFEYVITVCDEASAEKCPFVPGEGKRIHWSFPDPSALHGSEQSKLNETRVIRDAIRSRVQDWCKEVCAV